MSRELPIPDSVQADVGAVELIRVWAVHKKQHITLATGVWENPAAWGIMLADLARHIANSYSQTGQIDYSQALASIRDGFDAEWASPTDQPLKQ